MKDFYVFQNPIELFNKTEILSQTKGFVNERKYQKQREAWIMARFSCAYSKYTKNDIKISLSDEEPADAQMKVGRNIIDYQIVLANKPGRKLDLEYKTLKKEQNSSKTKPYRPVNLEEEARILRDILQKKVNKNYAGKRDLNLLIHSNFRVHGSEINNDMKITENIEIKSFQEVWIHRLSGFEGRVVSAISRVFPSKRGYFLFSGEALQYTSKMSQGR